MGVLKIRSKFCVGALCVAIVRDCCLLWSSPYKGDTDLGGLYYRVLLRRVLCGRWSFIGGLCFVCLWSLTLNGFWSSAFGLFWSLVLTWSLVFWSFGLLVFWSFGLLVFGFWFLVFAGLWSLSAHLGLWSLCL